MFIRSCRHILAPQAFRSATAIKPPTNAILSSSLNHPFQCQFSRAFSEIAIAPWTDGHEIPSVKATKRVDKGQNWSTKLRKDSFFKQIPATLYTNEHRDGQKNNDAQMNIIVDPTNLTKWLKQGNLYNTVFNLEIEGEDAPIQALVTNYETDLVTYQPLNYQFYRFFPDKKWNVKLPVKFENEEDSIVVKKGGFLLLASMYAPCKWRGDHKIPRAVTVDVLHTRVGKVYKLDNNKDMVPHLTLRYPERGPLVLGSCVGSRAATEVGEDEV